MACAKGKEITIITVKVIAIKTSNRTAASIRSFIKTHVIQTATDHLCPAI